jgi:hypothetical protein
VEQPLPPPEFNPPPVTTPVSDGLPWFDLIRSIVFWAIFIAIVVYAFKVFIEQNEYLWQRLRNLPGWRYLAAFLNWLDANFKLMDRRVRSAIQAGLMHAQSIERGEASTPRCWLFEAQVAVTTPKGAVLLPGLAQARPGKRATAPTFPNSL